MYYDRLLYLWSGMNFRDVMVLLCEKLLHHSNLHILVFRPHCHTSPFWEVALKGMQVSFSQLLLARLSMTIDLHCCCYFLSCAVLEFKWWKASGLLGHISIDKQQIWQLAFLVPTCNYTDVLLSKPHWNLYKLFVGGKDDPRHVSSVFSDRMPASGQTQTVGFDHWGAPQGSQHS